MKVFHQSEINMFLKCGLQWEFRYIQGIKSPPSAAMTVGSSVDAGVTRNLIQKIKTKSDLSESDVLDVYSTDFDIRAKEVEWGSENKGEQKDLGAQLLRLHHAQVAPGIKPVTVQENFILDTDAGYSLGGTIDLTEEGGVVADTKTSGKRYAVDSISKAIQPAMYDFAYESLTGKRAQSFRYDVLLKTKTPAYQKVEAKVTDEDRLWLFNTIDRVHRAIKAGIALPAPEGSWVCSKEYCGYWHRCKGAKK